MIDNFRDDARVQIEQTKLSSVPFSKFRNTLSNKIIATLNLHQNFA